METWLIIAVMHTTQAEKKIGIQEKHNKRPLQSWIFMIPTCCNQEGFGKPFMTKYLDYGYYCLKSNVIQLSHVTFAFLFCRHCLESSLFLVLLWQPCCRSSPLSSPQQDGFFVMSSKSSLVLTVTYPSESLQRCDQIYPILNKFSK